MQGTGRVAIGWTIYADAINALQRGQHCIAAAPQKNLQTEKFPPEYPDRRADMPEIAHSLALNEETRELRAWILKDLTEVVHDSRLSCPPLAGLWIAVLTAVTASKAQEQSGLIPSLTTTQAQVSDFYGFSPFLWANAPEWLGLDTATATEMLRPEYEFADWRAAPGDPGYITLQAISRMLEHFADTGEIIWGYPGSEGLSWESICQQYGIEWAAWQRKSPTGWEHPGTERTAIVRFRAGLNPMPSLYDIERQFSNMAGCNVSLITQEQLWDDRLDEELKQAEIIYAQA